MYKNLRIIFCCLAAALVASAVFIFVYAGLWGFIAVAAAAVCFFAMLHFKKKQEEQERAKNPPPPVCDFITGKVPAQPDGGKGADEEPGEKHN